MNPLSSVPSTTVAVPRGYRCVVCNAGEEVVAFVNRLIVGGSTYAEAHRALSAINEARVAIDQPEISYQSVMRHGRDHLPARSAAVREIVERRARAAQLDVEQGTVNIITAAAYAEAMYTKAFQDMADTPVTAAEGLAAAKFFSQLMAAERGNVGLETAFAELGYIIEAVKESVPPQLFAQILEKIDEKRGSRTIDAVVVDDEFDPGQQPEEEFSPLDDGEED
ncbi:MAG TPA: hypothetical protein VIY48_15105 [Candidatus Paceibacterota bacterium]